MSSPGTIGDPRSGRDRRVVTRTRTFKDGHIDPVIQHRRPLLTVGNIILVVIMVGFGMYATGNLPQFDAFFNNLDKEGRSHNDVVVHSLVTYGPWLFCAVVLGLFCLFAFLFINSSRHNQSEHRPLDAPPERRHGDRRAQNLPSMVMPLGKQAAHPNRRATDRQPTPVPIAAAEIATPVPASTQADIAAPAAEAAKPTIDPAKAAAMANAAKAEAALAATLDTPSFVRPRHRRGNNIVPSPMEFAKMAAAPPIIPVTLPRAATADATTLAHAAAAARIDAAISAAKAAAAKAEAAMAAALADQAIAEAAIAAARTEAENLAKN